MQWHAQRARCELHRRSLDKAVDEIGDTSHTYLIYKYFEVISFKKPLQSIHSLTFLSPENGISKV